jgi:oligoendopeptidase F
MVKTSEKRYLREEVPKNLTWDLRDLFDSEETWQDNLKMVEIDEGASLTWSC